MHRERVVISRSLGTLEKHILKGIHTDREREKQKRDRESDEHTRRNEQQSWSGRNKGEVARSTEKGLSR